MKLTDIHMRDPFVLPVQEKKTYYLFGTTDADPWKARGTGFDVYASTDLVDWNGPGRAFSPEAGFWAETNFWAPEVHEFNGGWYMFASFKSEARRRGTQILRASAPDGPYAVHSPGPVTPAGWECLDGTLFVEPAGAPWLVFCHEWVQVGDGEVRAVRLSDDLTGPVGEPVLLFTASGAPWVRELVSRKGTPAERRGYITDGPFVLRAADGGLLMLWSSFGDSGYAMGMSRSDSGAITGPWRHLDHPLVGSDGGHGMVFRDFHGALYATCHSPNRTPDERPVLFRVEENRGALVLVEG